MIIDHIRDLEEFREFYYTYKYPGLYDFNWIVNNPNLFCLYDEDSVLWGYISVQREHGVLSLSGASKRKNMQENINFINMVCDAFDEDMYAFTRVRPAIAVLRKASFKKVYDDKYVRLKRGKENGQKE
jgi:hypothetical protein